MTVGKPEIIEILFHPKVKGNSKSKKHKFYATYNDKLLLIRLVCLQILDFVFEIVFDFVKERIVFHMYILHYFAKVVEYPIATQLGANKYMSGVIFLTDPLRAYIAPLIKSSILATTP